MDRKISKEAKKELIEALRQRYGQASKQEKTKILDEFVAVAGCHRKHAVRLLGSDTPALPGSRTAGRRVYDDAVREALIVTWEAADRICGKRLKAILPSLVEAMERHDHLHLDPEVRMRPVRPVRPVWLPTGALIRYSGFARWEHRNESSRSSGTWRSWESNHRGRGLLSERRVQAKERARDSCHGSQDQVRRLERVSPKVRQRHCYLYAPSRDGA